MGVDPGKLPAMKNLLREQLDLLLTEPPSSEEIEEARHHLLGRYVSAAQSNPELTESLAGQWVLRGGLETEDDLKRRLENISRQDILDILPAFAGGSIVAIRNPAQADNRKNP
jgi:predicted Zn-dependent peptidase